MWQGKLLMALCLLTSSLALRGDSGSGGKSRESGDKSLERSGEESDEATFFNRKDLDSRMPVTTSRNIRGEVVVEKFVETLMASERYLKMIESVEKKLNHLDATFHERTNSILKYVGEMLRAVKTSPEGMTDALRSIKGDLGKLKLTVAQRLAEQPTMRGAKATEPHTCLCGSTVDCFGRHGLSCPSSAAVCARMHRHSVLNDIFRRSLASASISATLEPKGMSAPDGKRPDGVTLVPWRLGRPLAWDATVVDTLAPSYVASTARNAGAAAEKAQFEKQRKYAFLTADHDFIAIAMETLGPWSSDTRKFIKDVSEKLCRTSGDKRAGEYFAQRVSLAVQRGNAACMRCTAKQDGELDSIYVL